MVELPLNDEFERMWNEAAGEHFKVSSSVLWRDCDTFVDAVGIWLGFEPSTFQVRGMP
jgi:hypothetical protein